MCWRAVHMDVFIDALWCFIALRGPVQLLYSNQQSNSVDLPQIRSTERTRHRKSPRLPGKTWMCIQNDQPSLQSLWRCVEVSYQDNQKRPVINHSSVSRLIRFGNLCTFLCKAIPIVNSWPQSIAISWPLNNCLLCSGPWCFVYRRSQMAPARVPLPLSVYKTHGPRLSKQQLFYYAMVITYFKFFNFKWTFSSCLTLASWPSLALCSWSYSNLNFISLTWHDRHKFTLKNSLIYWINDSTIFLAKFWVNFPSHSNLSVMYHLTPWHLRPRHSTQHAAHTQKFLHFLHSDAVVWNNNNH